MFAETRYVNLLRVTVTRSRNAQGHTRRRTQQTATEKYILTSQGKYELVNATI